MFFIDQYIYQERILNAKIKINFFNKNKNKKIINDDFFYDFFSYIITIKFCIKIINLKFTKTKNKIFNNFKFIFYIYIKKNG